MSETTYEPNVFPKMPRDVLSALDALQESAILNGEGACKYSIMSEKRRLLERYIVDALHKIGRDAYDAGIEKGETAAQVAK